MYSCIRAELALHVAFLMCNVSTTEQVQSVWWLVVYTDLQRPVYMVVM